MMVAAHNHDLEAAQKLGLKTAFVARAEMSSSGTKYSPSSKSRPTSAIAGLMPFEIMSTGVTPAARAVPAASEAALASPVRIASCRPDN